jgi:hypothetical protein
MRTAQKRILAAVCLLAMAVTIVTLFNWWRARSDLRMIAELLKIEALPNGTKVDYIHKDLLPDTVVEAHLTIPAGTVETLIRGIPLQTKEMIPAHRSEIRGIRMTRFWGVHFSNADIEIECDETGRLVRVLCAMD